MSDDLEITSGGVISIDSNEVRAIGERLGAVSVRLQSVRDLLGRAQAFMLHQLASFISGGGVAECARRVDGLVESTQTAAHGVRVMADTFEYAELTAKLEAQGVERVSPAVQQRIDQLLAQDPKIADRVTMLRAGWTKEWTEGTGEQTWDTYLRGIIPPQAQLAGVPSIATVLGMGAILPSILKYGRPDADDRLTGEAPPVRVAEVSRSQVTPASGVQDSLQRIPSGDGGQVAVEKYVFEDGSEKFVAYVDGTRSPFWFTGEPWDMGSNTDMYVEKKTSASYAATMQALREAGVRPGDDLSLVTYSQGGAIGTYIAMDPSNNVGTWISAGNPTDPALGADQTYVDIRHRGDLVSNLAGGGDPGGTGSPESFAVRASVDPGSPIAPHVRTNYLDTAGQIDASGDPRVTAFDESYFAKLREAVSVERLEFEAKRP